MPSTNNLSDRIAQTKRLLNEADCVLIGAGAGLSAAAGIDYTGDDFRREFREWIDRYGITDLYSSSFYPFKTEEERWAYWARHIWFARFRQAGMPLYRDILKLVEHKDHFVITTNVDAQFEKSGFNPARIFATQGDYAYLQAASGMPKQLYYNKEQVMQMLEATHDCRIPTELIPHHPLTGERMTVNLRCDDTFVEDAHWHQQAQRYQAFVEQAASKRLVLLEFGIGFNTPVIIRFPFERMAASFPHAALVRFNRDEPQPFVKGINTFIPFTEDIGSIVCTLLTSS